jgi:hypothetical protein
MAESSGMNTGNKPASPRCALGKLIPSTVDTEKLKHDAWTSHRIIVAAIDDPRINWIERQILQTIGDKLFGRPRRG